MAVLLCAGPGVLFGDRRRRNRADHLRRVLECRHPVHRTEATWHGDHEEADVWRMDHAALKDFQTTSNLPWALVQRSPQMRQYFLTRGWRGRRPADLEMARVLKTTPLRMASDPSNGAIACWHHAAAPPQTMGFTLVGALFVIPFILVYTAWPYYVFRARYEPAKVITDEAEWSFPPALGAPHRLDAPDLDDERCHAGDRRPER
jgi:hypothetical protein